MDVPFKIVVAVDEKSGIGKQGELPWHIPGDMKHFKEITTRTRSDGKRNAVVMGRKTWESLPENFRPLPGRLNVVLTRNSRVDFPEGVLKFNDLQVALNAIKEEFGDSLETIFVIGGSEVFSQALKCGGCREIVMTVIEGDYGCDVFFPGVLPGFEVASKSETMSENGQNYRFVRYARK